jgi:restriction system protein
MAEITRRRQGELVRSVFEVLLEHPEGMPVSLLLKEVEQRLPPTPFEQSTYPRDPRVRRYEKIIRFSTIAAVKAGWLLKVKGDWSLTDEGRDAYKTFEDPEAFQSEATKLYHVWKELQPAVQDIDEETEGAQAATTLEEAEEDAWRDIRQYLVTMPPYDFQDLVAALLRAMGYHVTWIAPPGPDRGIDVIAHTDPLGATGPRIVVQVKRHAESKTSADGLRAFMAVLGDRDVGIFISTAGFTSEAEREARSQERRRLTLIDLNRLIELWVEHFDRLDDIDKQRLPLKPVYFLTPAT